MRLGILITMLLACLFAAAQYPGILIPSNHTSGVQSVQFSPDGSKILTSGDETAKIWDAQTGKLLMDFKGHSFWVTSAAFSPDGKKIVTASSDATAKVWDVRTGALLQELKGHTGKLHSAEFSPDGKKIVTASEDETAKVWDAENGNLIQELKGHKSSVLYAVFSPNGRRILTGSLWADGIIKVWNAYDGRLIGSLDVGKRNINHVSFSADGKRFAAFFNDIFPNDTAVKIWDAETGIALKGLENYPRAEEYVAFSPGWRKIASLSPKTVAKIWDVKTGDLLCELEGHKENINAISFSPDENKVATASEDGTAKIWDVESGKLLTTLKGHVSDVRTSFSSNCQKIKLEFADYYSKKTAYEVWDIKNAQLATGKVDSLGILEKEFAPPRDLVSAAGNPNINYLGADMAAIMSGILKDPRVIIYSRISIDRTRLLTSDYFGTTKIWDTRKGKLLSELEGSATLLTADFSPDLSMIAGCSEFGTIKVWEVSSGKLLSDVGLHTEDHILAAQFSPDCKRLIVSGRGSKVTVWDLINKRVITELGGHVKETYSPQFSPDGKKIVTIAYQDSLIQIWDASSYKVLTSIPISRSEILEDISWENGLLMTYQNYQIHLYDLESGKKKCSITSIDSNDYFVAIPSGYYKASTHGVKFLQYITTDYKVISFEQLDIKYNRPDLVLKEVGNRETGLINAFYLAYNKRLKRLGIDTTTLTSGLNIPTADFVNRDNIDYNQANDKLKLHIKANDSSSYLDRFNLWINETPLFGSKGYSLKKRKINAIDTIITVVLSDGINNIETSVTDVNGIESYRNPLRVNYTRTTPPLPPPGGVAAGNRDPLLQAFQAFRIKTTEINAIHALTQRDHPLTRKNLCMQASEIKTLQPVERNAVDVHHIAVQFRRTIGGRKADGKLSFSRLNGYRILLQYAHHRQVMLVQDVFLFKPGTLQPFGPGFFIGPNECGIGIADRPEDDVRPIEKKVELIQVIEPVPLSE